MGISQSVAPMSSKQKHYGVAFDNSEAYQLANAICLFTPKHPPKLSEGVVSQWAVWRFNGISQMGLPLFYPDEFFGVIPTAFCFCKNERLGGVLQLWRARENPEVVLVATAH